MDNQNQIVVLENIQSRIFNIRSLQVMLDHDLAEMYCVTTKRLNEQVKRNIERFPARFRFQLTEKEYDFLRSQIATSSLVLQDSILNKHGGRRYLPYVFTEQGVSMLSAILKSETAIKVSILIIDAFVGMRKFLSENASIFSRLDNIEKKQLSYQIKSDEKFEQVFKALENKSIKPKQGIFYDGQVFDAYIFIADLIKTASKSVILIDNYIDETVLQLFTKRHKNVSVTIYTKNITKVLKQDLKKHNSQYPNTEITQFTKAHDRFLIIDETTVYHFGASLKDLGKKWFAFSKMEMNAKEMIVLLNDKQRRQS
ncbi:MAG: ORF6N domain-containing protein [Draconibacterium sp.]|nr:ORF6N domain-containing protein [Draconibacterium sp.]